MKITNDNRKFPQIQFAFQHIYDNPEEYLTGDIYEFGVGAAQSTRKIVEYIKDNFDRRINLFGFDTFQGLPKEDENVELFPKYQPGAFAQDFSWSSRVYQTVNYEHFYMNYKLYKDLSIHDCNTDLHNKAILVHFDCDLYISTKQAMIWLFDNNLIQTNTLFAFDEFSSTKHDWNGGESKAFYEIVGIYGCKTKQVFKYIFHDKDCKQDIRQEVWKITQL